MTGGVVAYFHPLVTYSLKLLPVQVLPSTHRIRTDEKSRREAKAFQEWPATGEEGTVSIVYGDCRTAFWQALTVLYFVKDLAKSEDGKPLLMQYLEM